MRPRANWRGWLKLAEMSCAVGLYPATNENARTSFHQVSAKTGNRVRQQLVDEKTGEPVDRDDVRRGFEVAPGEHVILADEDLAALRIESTKLVEIERFVPESQVDPVYLEDHFLVAPDDHVSLDAFHLLRSGMAGRKVAAIGRIAMHGRERLLAISPRGRGMLASTLRYPYEIRDEDEVLGTIGDVRSDAALSSLMDQLIGRRTKKLRPEKFVDRYEEALVGFIRDRRKGTSSKRKRDDALVAALRKSLG